MVDQWVLLARGTRRASNRSFRNLTKKPKGGRPSALLTNPISNGSRSTVVTKSHYVSAPPDLRQLGPCDCVSDLRLSA
ncbi:unnamed protein product [Nippostrongylus brasiliensis]|uniref:Uncharacterized protein n=1 Tax=Nippostrongylus brasiliensis TaxID=27835 RepID=A0A0N4YFA2_NIPBR|nr:unnamed protein product [Nippostrongylus brasiliensis]